MAGLLPLESSFKAPQRHLVYRRAALLAQGILGPAGAAFRGHEFHYARALGEAGPAAPALFRAASADAEDLGAGGHRQECGGASCREGVGQYGSLWGVAELV